MRRTAVVRSSSRAERAPPSLRVALVLALLASFAAACVDKEQSQKLMKSFETGPPHPDEAPKMLNKELPFHYPPARSRRRVREMATCRHSSNGTGEFAPKRR